MSEPNNKKMPDNTLKARLERCKALQGNQLMVQIGLDQYEPLPTMQAYEDGVSAGRAEQVVGVKEGYSIAAFSNGTAPCGVDFSDEVPLSEALTLRTAEDVRREALEEAAKAVDGARCNPWATDTILALIDNPAPKQDTRALQAEAWDEGYNSCIDDAVDSFESPAENPYRKGDE